MFKPNWADKRHAELAQKHLPPGSYHWKTLEEIICAYSVSRPTGLSRRHLAAGVMAGNEARRSVAEKSKAPLLQRNGAALGDGEPTKVTVAKNSVTTTKGDCQMNAERFTLTIAMGNDAMSMTWHVADALEKVAARIHQGEDEGNIRDVNGNLVGVYKFIEEEPDNG